MIKNLNCTIKIALIMLFLCFILISANGCNNREDVKHLTTEEIITYAKQVINEPIEFISKSGEENDDTVTYTFKLTNRNINFSITSNIDALFIDGSRFSNYKESLNIYYESAIMFDTKYILEREKIAKQYNIQDILDGSGEYKYYTTTITNFNDLQNLANFYLSLDKLYNFQESKPEKVYHIDSGTICADVLGSITGIQFSNNNLKKLKYKDIYKDLEKRYIGHLKWFNLNDQTVPNKLLKKYTAAP